jgi:hydrogenase expression/formation protein HypD
VKYIDEYREGGSVGAVIERIERMVTRPWNLMEICGGQTHSIIRFGIDELLPDRISLIHGPGCPVCVTPIGLIDQAIELTTQPDVVLCSFGDMLRVPGSDRDLFAAKAAGGDVRIVYSPMDALALAQRNPEKKVVFFAVGFETTAPANAMAVYQARKQGVTNFFILVSHVLVPPAMEAILSSPDNRVDGFLAAGHVCTIMGESEYHSIAERFKVPIVVTGFEPLDLVQGVYHCVKQLEEGRHVVENQYARAVRSEGNATARELMNRVFVVTDRCWRGIGEIPNSGLALGAPYHAHDAVRHFKLEDKPVAEDPECQAGSVLRGLIKPDACPAFGHRCTPERPLGAPMVSNEGACAAYYRHRRNP